MINGRLKENQLLPRIKSVVKMKKLKEESQTEPGRGVASSQATSDLTDPSLKNGNGSLVDGLEVEMVRGSFGSLVEMKRATIGSLVKMVRAGFFFFFFFCPQVKMMIASVGSLVKMV